MEERKKEWTETKRTDYSLSYNGVIFFIDNMHTKIRWPGIHEIMNKFGCDVTY